MTNQDQKKLAQFWLDGSVADMAAAKQLILIGKLYPQGLFFLHLSIEKMLKYAYILKFGTHAPFTHNLLHLLDRCEFLSSDSIKEKLAVINEFNLTTRYPDQKALAKKKFNATFSKKYLLLGLGIHKWLLKESKSTQ